MITLGKANPEEVRERFLKKFQEQRDDADEYTFGTMKGEQMKTTVVHSVCGQAFESRPYLFLQEKWQKRCPYCYSTKKNKLTEEDIIERINEVSNGRIKFLEDKPRYYKNQKTHQITMECLDCGHVFERNLQNIRGSLSCPKCKTD